MKKIFFIFSLIILGSYILIQFVIVPPAREVIELGKSVENNDKSDIEVTQKVAQFFETNPKGFDLSPEKPEKKVDTAPTSENSFRDPTISDTYQTPDSHDELIQIYSENPEKLMDDLNKNMRALAPNDVKGRVYLLHFAADLKEKAPKDQLENFFLRQAEEGYNSQNPEMADFAKKALSLYLSQEPDPEIRTQKEREFTSTHPLLEEKPAQEEPAPLASPENSDRP